MNDVERLIEHLLTKEFSIDSVRSIVEQLKINRDDLMRILDDQRYADFFQLLRPSKNSTEKIDKIALTFDLFCCTHYGHQCKNEKCPFLHLCPFHIRPMSSRCTNRNCPFEHEVNGDSHNRRILEARGLLLFPKSLLFRVVRASADPQRSFWVCTDYPKNTCQKKNQCDRLHFCYFQLIDRCTKPACQQHTINTACQTYFRTRQISEQNHEDIFQAFGKVLRQRKADYLTTNRVASTAAGASASTSASAKSELPQEIPAEDRNDVFLIDPENPHENRLVEDFLSRSIGCPIKLVSQKFVTSKTKTPNGSTEPIFYYVSSSTSTDVFHQLRWQNLRKDRAKPLTVYSTPSDAHQSNGETVRTNSFFLLRLELRDRNFNSKDSTRPAVLQLDDPSKISFDRLWIYFLNF